MTRWRLPVGVGAGLLALPLLLGAFPFEAGQQGGSPTGVVRSIDAAMEAGERALAHAAFEYRAKGRAMLPDLWEAAPENERAALIALLQPLFETTWRQARESPNFAGRIALLETYLSPDRALVEQLAPDAEGDWSRAFGLRYWLARGDAGWQVVDRTTLKDGVHHESSGLVKVIRSRIRGELGREPTLGEFVANAPSWLERVRVRTIQADDLLGR